jgi:3-oxoacyl-[acyl-carrier protein] reductase
MADKRIPLKRLGTPDDMAAAAIYLASDAGSWVTGQTLTVAGGL